MARQSVTLLPWQVCDIGTCHRAATKRLVTRSGDMDSWYCTLHANRARVLPPGAYWLDLWPGDKRAGRRPH